MNILYIANFAPHSDEGMRNIAKHYLSDCGGRYTYQALTPRQTPSLFFRSTRRSFDLIHIILRANFKCYLLALLLKFLFSGTPLVLSVVQPPRRLFLKAVSLVNPWDGVLSLADDNRAAFQKLRIRTAKISVGVDFKKFRALPAFPKADICARYGMDPNKVTVLHVGHCSKGRNLETMLNIDGRICNRIVICSGMFTDPKLHAELSADGVFVIDEYLHNIELFYNVADVYFFPTLDRNYVIDVPLSIIEALSCGIPAVILSERQLCANVPVNDPRAVWVYEPKHDLTQEIVKLAALKRKRPYIDGSFSWERMTESTLDFYQDILGIRNPNCISQST